MELQTIREKLRLSQRDIAYYLGISIHTVKAIEQGHRQVPLDMLDGKADLIKATLNEKAGRRVATDFAAPTKQQMRLMKRLRDTYTRRLDKYTLQLEKMQQDCATASRGLAFVRQVAASLARAGAKADPVRLHWSELKTAELTRSLTKNNAVAQQILTMEIAGLQVRIKQLDALVSGSA
jgi:transcriptional regulator with XRE-family HTH domain